MNSTRLAQFRSRYLWPAALTVLLICVFAAIGLSPAQYIPLALLLGVTGQRIIALIAHANLDMFAPSNVLAGYFIIFFGLRALYVLTYPTAKQIGVFYYFDYLPNALWCALLGYLSCLAGINSGLPVWIARRFTAIIKHFPQWPSSAPNLRIAVMLMVGGACWMYLLSQGAFVVGDLKQAVRINSVDPVSGVPTLLATLVDMGSTASVICLLVCARRHGRLFTWALLVLFVSFIMFRLAYTGSKQLILEPIGQALLIFHYVRRRLTIGRLIIIGFPIVLTAFGIVNLYRFVAIQQAGGAPRSASELIEKIDYAYEYFTSDRQEQIGTTAFEMLMEREFGVDSLAVMIKFTPERRPWGLGEDYINIPVQLFVPRLLWPDKPVHYVSGNFERDYLGASWVGGFTAIHLISDLYQNLHVFGVAVGMFLVGSLLQALYVVCGPIVRGASGAMAYTVIILGTVHSLEWDLTSIVQYYTRYLVLAGFVVWFLCARAGRKTAA